MGNAPSETHRADSVRCRRRVGREGAGPSDGPGRADRSYGVHVARLAGVPRDVTARADEVLASLSVQEGQRVETGRIEKRKRNDQLGLFTEYVPHPAVERLKELKLDGMTPLQAFDALRRLQEEASGEG